MITWRLFLLVGGILLLIHDHQRQIRNRREHCRPRAHHHTCIATFDDKERVDGPSPSKKKMVGATRPLEAAPGSIRGDYALDVGENIVHASDGPETAAEEMQLWFGAA